MDTQEYTKYITDEIKSASEQENINPRQFVFGCEKAGVIGVSPECMTDYIMQGIFDRFGVVDPVSELHRQFMSVYEDLNGNPLDSLTSDRIKDIIMFHMVTQMSDLIPPEQENVEHIYSVVIYPTVEFESRFVIELKSLWDIYKDNGIITADLGRVATKYVQFDDEFPLDPEEYKWKLVDFDPNWNRLIFRLFHDDEIYYPGVVHLRRIS